MKPNIGFKKSKNQLIKDFLMLMKNKGEKPKDQNQKKNFINIAIIKLLFAKTLKQFNYCEWV